MWQVVLCTLLRQTLAFYYLVSIQSVFIFLFRSCLLLSQKNTYFVEKFCSNFLKVPFTVLNKRRHTQWVVQYEQNIHLPSRILFCSLKRRLWLSDSSVVNLESLHCSFSSLSEGWLKTTKSAVEYGNRRSP